MQLHLHLPPSTALQCQNFSIPVSHSHHSMRTWRIFLLLVLLESAQVLSAPAPAPASQTTSTDTSQPTIICNLPESTHSPGLRKRGDHCTEIDSHLLNQTNLLINLGVACASVLVLSLVPFYQSLLGTANGGLGWVFQRAFWVGNRRLGNVSRLRC